ncbi:serine hydrolase [Natroniella sp. ANB-PHB2]|uniref:serine hydrolase n=1 Tax=Natroniella sp. ANB-PHB2 TaxID=3384444 RepID=UPI0038D3E7DC
MKKLIIVMFVGVLILFSASFYVRANSIEAEELETFLDGVIFSQLDEHDISGVTLSVVKDGEILVSKGYGYADLEKRKAVDPKRTLFRPGSVSKLFTWTAVMQLVEQNKLDLNEDINNYLDFEIPNTILGKGSTEAKPITMKHLMTHTPGFEDVGEGLFVLSEEEMLSLEEYLKQYLPARVFPSGEILAYSNYGTALAGYIVEQVSRQAFEEYVDEHIFKPLEMNYSTFKQPLPDELAPYMTRAYKLVEGEYYEGSFEYISGSPAGSMSVSAEDMARFMIAHLQNGSYGEQRILQEESVKKMHQQQFTHHSEVQGMALGFIEDNLNGERIITHGGGTSLFFSGLYLLPEHNIGLFVSYSDGTGMEAIKLFQAFMDRYYPEKLNIEEKPLDEEAQARAMAYVGNYYPNRINFSTFEKLLDLFQSIQVNINEEGYLVADFLGEVYQFVEVEEGVYKNRNNNGTQLIKTMAFVSDSEGQTMLAPGGPTTYSKSPWYGSISFLSLLTVLAILLMLGTLLGWIISFLIRWFRKKESKSSRGAKAARLIVVAFVLLTFIFLVGMISIFTDINPAYGVPNIMFNIYNPVLFYFLSSLPYFMLVLTVAMVVLAVISWREKYWTLGSRLHYSFVTLMTGGLMWVMYYTNLL